MKSLASIYYCLALLLTVCYSFYSCKKEVSQNAIEKGESFVEINLNNDNLDFYLPISNTHDIVKHRYYTLSYNEKYEQAEWVAYELKRNELSKSNFDRPYFIDDPEVESGSASWKNYKKSGYDKGHLCPAGDRRFLKEAFDETFYTSNITPQKKDFNAGIWNKLEQKTRYWASKFDGIYVFTGGVLSPDLKTIGKEDVAVPGFFYKILLDNTKGKYKVIVFLLPHEDSDRPLTSFVVSVDQIEQITGINFFPNLPDEIENMLEKNSDYKKWGF
jgi:endonuclease G, mitochondrial